MKIHDGVDDRGAITKNYWVIQPSCHNYSLSTELRAPQKHEARHDEYTVEIT